MSQIRTYSAEPFVETNPKRFQIRAGLVSLILGEIADQMAIHDIGEIELARRIGVKPKDVRNILESFGAMTLDEVADTFYALGCTVEGIELVEEASPLEPGETFQGASS